MHWEVYAWGPYETIDAALERIPPDHRQAALDELLNSDLNQRTSSIETADRRYPPI